MIFWTLAYVFKMDPNVIGELEIEDLDFWIDGAGWAFEHFVNPMTGGI